MVIGWSSLFDVTQSLDVRPATRPYAAARLPGLGEAGRTLPCRRATQVFTSSKSEYATGVASRVSSRDRIWPPNGAQPIQVGLQDCSRSTPSAAAARGLLDRFRAVDSTRRMANHSWHACDCSPSRSCIATPARRGLSDRRSRSLPTTDPVPAARRARAVRICFAAGRACPAPRIWRTSSCTNCLLWASARFSRNNYNAGALTPSSRQESRPNTVAATRSGRTAVPVPHG